jgi:hypothetical protein
VPRASIRVCVDKAVKGKTQTGIAATDVAKAMSVKKDRKERKKFTLRCEGLKAETLLSA